MHPAASHTLFLPTSLAQSTLASLCLLFTAGVGASDWQYAGYVKAGGVESHQFYDAETVSSPAKDSRRFWVKSIQVRQLNRYYKAHEKVVVEKSARKLVSGYVPKFTELEPITAKYQTSQPLDAIAEVISYEIVANEPGVPTYSKIYFEIDCAGHRIRLLAGTVYGDNGDIKSTKAGQPSGEYEFIAPDSNGQWLSQLLCPRK